MVMSPRRERGIALALVLLAITFIAALAFGLTLSSSEARMSAANQEEAVALANAAESALELAARELGATDLTAVLSGAQASSLVDGAPGFRTVAPAVVIDLPVLTNQLTCGRRALCTPAQVAQSTQERPWGANNPRWRLFVHQPLPAPDMPKPAAPAYIVVWIGDDAREDDGDPSVDGAGAAQEGRYIVRARAEAFGWRGGRRAIEAELARMCVAGPGGDVCVPSSRVQSWRAVAQTP
jgi:hypothetical protein